MKRVLLIAGGTVGGLGAVLSVTPPNLGSNGISSLAGASADTSAPAANQSANQTVNSNVSQSAAVATKKSAPTTTVKKSTTSTTSKSSSTTKNSTSSSSTSSNASTQSNPTVTTPTTTPITASASGPTGTFTGDAFNVNYGIVQVKITVSNGKITDAVAIQAPSGRNQRFTDYAIPNLRSQTLSAQCAAIHGAGGASYTSYGWYKSLISALQKAGMPTGV